MFRRQHWPLNNKKYIIFVLKQVEIATSIKATKNKNKSICVLQIIWKEISSHDFLYTFFHVSLDNHEENSVNLFLEI